MPFNIIMDDLRHTHSLEVTTDNILEGNIAVPSVSNCLHLVLIVIESMITVSPPIQTPQLWVFSLLKIRAASRWWWWSATQSLIMNTRQQVKWTNFWEVWNLDFSKLPILWSKSCLPWICFGQIFTPDFLRFSSPGTFEESVFRCTYTKYDPLLYLYMYLQVHCNWVKGATFSNALWQFYLNLFSSCCSVTPWCFPVFFVKVWTPPEDQWTQEDSELLQIAQPSMKTLFPEWMNEWMNEWINK